MAHDTSTKADADPRTPRVIALGSVNVDIEVRVRGRRAQGESLRASDFRMAGGGKAANIAYAARRLGAAAALAGRIGDDALAPIALAPLHQAGVDLRATHAVPGESTGLAFVVLGDDAECLTVFSPNANACWRDDDARAMAALVDAAPAGSVLAVDVEVPAFVAMAAMRAAHARGHGVVLDPSPAQRVTPAMLALADYVTPDAAEAQVLAGIAIDTASDAAVAARALVAQGARAACVKLRGGGCAVADAGRTFVVRCPRVQVVDTTGAGDAFAAALAVATMEGRTLEEAARRAAAASMIAVTRYGAQASVPDRTMLEAAARDTAVDG